MSYYELFEKNILDEPEELLHVLRYDPESLKEYVSSRKNEEGSAAIKSSAFRKIYKLYLESVENGELNLRHFDDSYSTGAMYNVRDLSKIMFFDQFDLFQLLTGEEFFKTDKERRDELYLEHLLTEDRTNFKLPLPPFIIKSMLNGQTTKLLTDNIKLSASAISEERDLGDYFMKSGGLMSILPTTKIKELLEDLLDNDEYGMFSIYHLMNNYNDYGMGSDYEGRKINDINVKKFSIALWEIVIERGIESIIEKDYPYELEEQETKQSENFSLLSSALLVKDMGKIFEYDMLKYLPKIIEVCQEMNKLEKHFKVDYANSLQLDNEMLKLVVEKIAESGDVFYITSRYDIMNIQDAELLNSIRACGVESKRHSEDVEEYLKEKEKEAVWSTVDISPQSLSSKVKFRAKTKLKAIFGQQLQDEKNKDTIDLFKFLNENKKDFFEFKKDFIVDITIVGMKNLLKYKEEMNG